jgi:hypothetical protein
MGEPASLRDVNERDMSTRATTKRRQDRPTPALVPGGDEQAAAAPDDGESVYLWALIAGLGVGLLYTVTLSPTTAFWDTSEYIATGHILGIPHPPGNPLFVLMARTWELLLAPLGLTVATRINLFSAFMGSVAHGLWFLAVHHILSYFSDNRRFRIIGAMAAVAVSATAFTVWNQSNVNEKVYTVSLMTIALLTWLVFHWRENLGKGRDDNLLILIAFVLALSVGNHLMAFLAAPALALFVLWVSPRVLLNWRLYAVGVFAVFLGLSIHLYLPLRAALGPIINEADPTCSSLKSALTSIGTLGRAGCTELSAALSRQQYLKPPVIPRASPLWSQFANYLQYFDWQWARGVAGSETVFPLVRLPFTFLFACLGLYGGVQHLRRDAATGLYLLALFATLSVGLVFYLNFPYGFSLASPSPDDIHEVRERDYFFIVSFSVWGLWVGIGIAALWQRAREYMGGSWSRAAPVLLLALFPLLLNWPWASRRSDYSARDWAYNLLMSVEPYGVLFTNGDNDTFPLWYLQEAEGIRRDVTVIVTSYLNLDWYVKQLRQLTTPCPPGVQASDSRTTIVCQRPYEPQDGEPLYTTDPGAASSQGRTALLLESPVTPPTRTVLPLDDEVVEQVAGPAGYVSLAEDRDFALGPVVARIRGGTVIYPWQQFALLLIQSSIDDRPIYFASSGSAARDLGVVPYLVRHGLAFRLFPGPPDLNPRNVFLEDEQLLPVTGPWLDAERTRVLAQEVFIHRTGIPDEWKHWPDRSTIGIPNYYAWVFAALAQGALQTGDEGLQTAYEDRLIAWRILSQ